MIVQRATVADERLEAAVAEMQATIRSRYPDATFTIGPGHDPPGLYMTATVDVEDSDEVFDLIVGRLLKMQVDEGLPLYVLPVERVGTESRSEPTGPRPTDR